MRKIGELSQEGLAKAFGDALFVRGLENDVEAEDDGTFSIWVHDDEQLEKGRALLEEFRANPEDAAWQDATRKAERQRKQEQKAAELRSSQVITRERMEYERNSTALGWGPVVIAILSIAATIFAGELSLFPKAWTPQFLATTNDSADPEQVAQQAEAQKRFNLLAITAWKMDSERIAQVARELIAKGIQPTSRTVERLFYSRDLPEIRKGEVWRLITPIFVHLGLLHLAFNLFWLRDLGSFTQHRFGALYFWVLVVSISAICNLTQFAWRGPLFGGLSGLNYGLLGFLWMRGKFDRLVVWQLSPQILQSMIGWYFLCLLGIMPIANAAHTAGLLFGMLAGYVTAQISNARLLKL